MKKYHLLFYSLAIIGLVISSSSCRKDFLTGFPDPEIINAPPSSSPIPDINLRVGFGQTTLNLSAYFTDPENDPLTFNVINTDDAVVTLSVDGATLTIDEQGPGVSGVTITASDPNPGNESDPQAFNIIVEDLPPIEYTFSINFDDVPDGTTDGDIMVEGASLSFEGSGGAVHEVQGGVLNWTNDEFSLMIIEFDEPLDLTANSQLQFDYADLWDTQVFLFFEDEDGNFSELELGELDLGWSVNNPNFTTLDEGFLLSDYAFNEDEGTTIDMSKITVIGIEKFGGTAGGNTFRFDNLNIGPKAASAPFTVYMDFSTFDNGPVSELAFDGFTVSLGGDDVSSATIENGVLLLDVREFYALDIAFDSPVDLSGNSEMEFEYADLWDDEFYMFFGDDSGGESEEIEWATLGLDFTFNDVNFNTFEGFDLADYAEGVDLSALSSLYFEKAAGSPDGSTVLKLRTLGIGRIE